MKLFNCWIRCFFLSLPLFVFSTGYAQLKMPQEIVFATVYNIFHDRLATDEEFFTRVDRDIANIKKAHFNTVVIKPFGQWNRRTRQPDYVRTDYLINKISEHGLKFIPIMLEGTYRHWLPKWKWSEIDDAAREFPGQIGSEEVKYQHPVVQQALEEYFQNIAGRYKNHPALLAYNIWNEPHYMSLDEITIPKFQAWLKQKYGTLDELNRVWAEDYTDWEQINLLRVSNWESSMSHIDWELFRHANIAEIAGFCKETMRKYDPIHPLIINPVDNYVALSGSSAWNRIDPWTVDNWAVEPESDITGISFFPGWYEGRTGKKYPTWRYAFVFNANRSVSRDKPWYLAELQTNQQNGLALSKYMSYDDIHLLNWLSLANDCKGIVFWQWLPFFRGQQSFGRGLCRTDGTLAPRGEAARDVATVLKRSGALLKNANLLPAKAAILYDQVSRIKSEDQPTFNPQSFTLASLEGTFQALWEENITVDVVRSGKIRSLDQLTRYKILYLPFQLVMRPHLSRLLKKYVKKGGWVVADARSAIMNQFDFGYEINPGPDLVELFGARRLDWYGEDTAFQVVLGENPVLGSQVPPGTVVEGVYYKEQLEIRPGTQVIGTYRDSREPAMVVHDYGKGRAILSAVPLGGSYERLQKKKLQKLIAAFAKKAGAAPEAVLESAQSVSAVSLYVHRVKDTAIVYAINVGDTPVAGSLKLEKIPLPRSPAAVDLISGRQLECHRLASGIVVEVSIPAKRAAVIRFE